MRKLYLSVSHRRPWLAVCMWLLAISVWGAPRQATAERAYQQRRERTSVSFRNASLAEVLQRIKQQTGYYILYNSDAVPGNRRHLLQQGRRPGARSARRSAARHAARILDRRRHDRDPWPKRGGNASAPQKAPDQGRQRTCDGHGRRAARGREHPDPGDRHGSRVGVRRRILDPHARGPRPT